jgi:hypothetical protein
VLLRPVGSAVDGALPPAAALCWAPILPPPVRRGGGGGANDGAGDGASGEEDEEDEEDEPRVAFLCAAGAFVLAVVAGPPPRRAPALRLEGSTLLVRALPAAAGGGGAPSLLWAGQSALFVSCPGRSSGSTELWALNLDDADDSDDDSDNNKNRYQRGGVGSPGGSLGGAPVALQAVLLASSAPTATTVAVELLPEGACECVALVAGGLVLAPRSGLPPTAATPGSLRHAASSSRGWPPLPRLPLGAGWPGAVGGWAARLHAVDLTATGALPRCLAAAGGPRAAALREGLAASREAKANAI